MDHDQGLALTITDGTPDPRSVFSHRTDYPSHLDKLAAHNPVANGIGKASARVAGERNVRPVEICRWGVNWRAVPCP